MYEPASKIILIQDDRVKFISNSQLKRLLYRMHVYTLRIHTLTIEIQKKSRMDFAVSVFC
jgi:hypothetical protein